MSVSATSCHFLGAAIPAIAGATRSAVICIAKAASGSDYRGLVHLSPVLPGLESVEEQFGVECNGSGVPASYVRSGGEFTTTAPFAFWEGSASNRWTVLCAWMDTGATAADSALIYGRSAATAIAATQTTPTGNISPSASVFDNIRVLRDIRALRSGSPANDSTNAVVQISHVCVVTGVTPTTGQIQSLINGTNPVDIWGANLVHYWPLETSAGGLTDVVGGVTLAPSGGAATVTWHNTDNPTVNPASGGSSNGSAAGTTRTLGVSLIPGSASGVATGQGAGTTRTLAVSLIPGTATGGVSGTLQFQNDANKFIARVGSGIGTFALEVGINYRYEVFANGTTLGNPIYTSGLVATDSNGKLPNLTSNLFTPGVTYKVVPTRESDGESGYPRKMVAV